MNFKDIQFLVTILQKSENSGFIWQVNEGSIIIQTPLKLYNKRYEIKNKEEYNKFCAEILTSGLNY